MEFEDGGFKGAELAKIARENGFVGCQILHSAQESLGNTVDAADGIFDGFVEKTASRALLIAGIKRAWESHRLQSRETD